jgi:type I restriction enzyme, S subunit
VFTRLDAADALLMRAQTNLDRYRGAVLAAAMRGHLLIRHAAMSRSGEMSSEVARARFAAGMDLRASRFDLPQGWVWTSVRNAGEVKLGRQRSPQHHAGPHMRPYLRVAIVFDDHIDLSDVKEMNFTPSEFDSYALRSGDILLNEGQSLELVGRSAMFRGELENVAFQNTLVRFRASDAVDCRFALIVFRAYQRNGLFRSIARWTTSIAHLGAERFANLRFPLPPLAEQRCIAVEVERRMYELGVLEAAIEANRKRARRLRESILKRAFEGRLVPRDPTDEPPSILLDHIRADPARNNGKAPKTRDVGARAKPATPLQQAPLPI